MFSTVKKTNSMFWVTFNLSSKNTFNLDKAKILSFGKGLDISIFTTTRISMQYHLWFIYIFLWYTMDIFRTKKWYTTEIFRTCMYFQRVNVTCYDAVNMIHDAITTVNPFQYTAKFIFLGVTNNKTQQIRRWKIYRIRIIVLPYINKRTMMVLYRSPEC